MDGVIEPGPPAVARRDLPTPAGSLALLDTGGPAGQPPVLLVPGFTGSKEDFALLLAPLAAAGHRAVAMDQRGQFESVGPDDPGAYTVDALAADVLAVLADLAGPADLARRNGRPAHLVGHSFGGLVARAATLARPDAVASLVLLGSGPSAIGGSRRQRMEALAPLLTTGGMAAVYEGMEKLAAGDGRQADAPPELKAFLRRRFLASSPVGLQAMGEALRSEPDRVDALRATGVPVLVTHGAGDDAWLPAVQADMAGRLGARYVPIPACAHSPAVENPAGTMRTLLDFWSSVARG
jgi:pimeloyl-ACP methyl ester carboxylesterase